MKSSDTSPAEDTLRQAGLKSTQARRSILNMLHEQSDAHLSAEAIFQIWSQEDPSCSLATVYRVLSQLEEAGLILKHHFGQERALYELNRGEHHDHLLCLQCGRICEFVDPSLEARQESIAQDLGFVLQAHSMQLYASCQKAQQGQCPYLNSALPQEDA